MVKLNAQPDWAMLAGIVGLLIAAFLLFEGSFDRTWVYSLGILGAILLLSSLLSLSPALPDHVKKKKRRL